MLLRLINGGIIWGFGIQMFFWILGATSGTHFAADLFTPFGFFLCFLGGIIIQASLPAPENV